MLGNTVLPDNEVPRRDRRIARVTTSTVNPYITVWCKELVFYDSFIESYFNTVPNTFNNLSTSAKMVTRLRRPPKSRQKITPVKPPKGHFFFAGRAFERVKWWKLPKLRLLYFYIVILILTNTANGFDGSMMNGLQSLSYWQDYFGVPRGAMLGFFNSSMSLGSLIGLPIVPYLIDWKGRKIGIVLGSVVMLVAVALQTGAQNIGMFIAARLILGFGDTLMLNSAPLLIAEIAHPQDRAVLVTLSGASYHSGAFIASWVTYGTLQIKV